MRQPAQSHGRTAGRRPKSSAAEAGTREAILASARSVFARRGLDGASIREVARTARVNAAMIYYHFADKGELYRAVLADSFSAFDGIWDHPLFQSSASARNKIQKFAEEFIRFQQSNEELRRIMSMEFAACSKNCKWLADSYFTRSYERLSQILRQGMKAGELRKIDPAHAVPSLVGMIIHSFIMRPMAEYIIGNKLDLSIARFGKFVTETFFDGICANKQEKSRSVSVRTSR